MSLWASLTLGPENIKLLTGWGGLRPLDRSNFIKIVTPYKTNWKKLSPQKGSLWPWEAEACFKVRLAHSAPNSTNAYSWPALGQTPGLQGQRCPPVLRRWQSGWGCRWVNTPFSERRLWLPISEGSLLPSSPWGIRKACPSWPKSFAQETHAAPDSFVGSPRAQQGQFWWSSHVYLDTQDGDCPGHFTNLHWSQPYLLTYRKHLSRKLTTHQSQSSNSA